LLSEIPAILQSIHLTTLDDYAITVARSLHGT
jgi:hypothetical protein